MSGLTKTSSQDPEEIFQILAKLGEGSYGSVYKALDKRDGKIVAIKVLEVENEDTEALQKEINILRECNSPYIVAYKGTYEKDNNIWIVMEYCIAGSICDLMAICEKTLNETQIAIVMKMALMGLSYLHGAKKIHRDIKSGNILLNHEGDCKLADFGVSAELTTTMAKRKTVIGTPYWMAPEVLQSTEYNGKADIWSLAITAYEMAVGEPPHSNVHPMRAIFMIPTSDPPTLPNPSQYSADFNDFLRVCLQKNPNNRPTADQLLKTHPFILKAKGKQTIAQLVDECMQQIDEYREQEAKEAEEKDSDTGTMVGTGTVRKGAISMSTGGTDEASGTMVYNPNNKTMADPAADDGEEEFGTMIYNKEQKKSNEDGFMNMMNHPKENPNGSFSATGTMIAKKGPVGGAKTETKEYYRTGRKLDVSKESSLLELRSGLDSLNIAYEQESQALEQFYADRRKQLHELISVKEKTLKAKAT